MTVIAALRLEGIPALIGDFLLTDSRQDLPHAGFLRRVFPDARWRQTDADESRKG
jgi:hypothetical protein